MNKLILGLTALAVIPTTAVAQDAVESSSSLTNAYIGVSTGLAGTADYKIGTELNLAGLGSYAEFQYKDRVDAAGEPADDYAIKLGGGLDLVGINIDSGVSYSWGASGGDLIGLGDNNTWGDLTSSLTASVSPGIIGGEYFYIGGTASLATAGQIDVAWTGASYGVGYSHDFNEKSSLNVSYGWEVDSETWETESTGLNVGVGFKF